MNDVAGACDQVMCMVGMELATCQRVAKVKEAIQRQLAEVTNMHDSRCLGHA